MKGSVMKSGTIKNGISVLDISAFVLLLVGGIFTLFGIIFACNITQMQAHGSGNVAAIPTVFLTIGLSLLGIGAVFAFFSARKRAMIRQVVKDGHYVMAEVLNIRQNFSVHVNGISPYVLECHYTDPVTGTLHVFSSRNLFFYPAELLGTRVRVYVDPADLDHYYVDAENSIPDVRLH